MSLSSRAYFFRNQNILKYGTASFAKSRTKKVEVKVEKKN